MAAWHRRAGRGHHPAAPSSRTPCNPSARSPDGCPPRPSPAPHRKTPFPELGRGGDRRPAPQGHRGRQ
eukprot:2214437-Lingulodinium_polyedra.AAC.1